MSRAAAMPVYLGDELAACGWRLAGVRTEVPAAGDEAAALARACASGAPLALLSAALAARIDAAALAAAGAALEPLLLVVPDTQGTIRTPALAERLRAQLGLEPAAGEAR